MKRHYVKKCRYCRGWYNDSIKALKYVENKEMRKKLKDLFETLWLNNCSDFDIIWYEFAANLKK